MFLFETTCLDGVVHCVRHVGPRFVRLGWVEGGRDGGEPGGHGPFRL